MNSKTLYVAIVAVVAVVIVIGIWLTGAAGPGHSRERLALQS